MPIIIFIVRTYYWVDISSSCSMISELMNNWNQLVHEALLHYNLNFRNIFSIETFEHVYKPFKGSELLSIPSDKHTSFFPIWPLYATSNYRNIFQG